MGVGTATAKSMVLNTVLVHIVGMVGTQIFWGSNPRAPDRRMTETEERGLSEQRGQGGREPLDPREWEEPRVAPGRPHRPRRTPGRASCRDEDVPDNIREQTREGEDPYQWHSGRTREHGATDAVEFIDVKKSFGRNTRSSTD